MNEFKTILADYLEVLTEYGSAGPKTIKPAPDMESILKLNELTKVDLPEDLITWFQTIDGYDFMKAHKYDDDPQEIAWGMAAMSIKEVVSAAKNAGFNGENDTYWPFGFVPILFNYGADYVVVNCVRQSPTYGAVYDLTEGIGVSLLAHDLSHFITCSKDELTSGYRIFQHTDEDYEFQSITTGSYQKLAEIYGNTPCFQRNQTDEQVIDWI